MLRKFSGRSRSIEEFRHSVQNVTLTFDLGHSGNALHPKWNQGHWKSVRLHLRRAWLNTLCRICLVRGSVRIARRWYATTSKSTPNLYPKWRRIDNDSLHSQALESGDWQSAIQTVIQGSLGYGYGFPWWSMMSKSCLRYYEQPPGLPPHFAVVVGRLEHQFPL